MPVTEGRTNRGCGQRIRGGCYACTGLSPFGKPIEEFLIDPPISIDTEPFRSPQMFQKDGRNHVFIWIGEQYYPTMKQGHCTPKSQETCIGLNYPLASLFPQGIDFAPDVMEQTKQPVTRSVGDVKYDVLDARNMGEVVKYSTGVFAVFPITRLEYVRGEEGEVNNEVVEFMQKSSIPVELCDD